jgi:Saxitoxin biosynthesis operon protein SxtJ
MSVEQRKKPATASDARSFGFLVGGAFLVIALISWYRHKPAALWETFAILGGALALLGATVPVILIPVYRAWMGFALILSRITTPVFMGVVYFVVLTPIGALRRLFGANALVATKGADGYWVTVSKAGRSMERQF